MVTRSLYSFGITILLLSQTALLFAVEPEDEILAGHSSHGEVFNEGPRQSAYLMSGMGNVSFPATTESELAQRFINQGVAQLHGFWYYEAERSFRQAAVIDPDCAIAYWGMAMANTGNRKREQDFIAEADARKENASRREQMYIAALLKSSKDEDDKGKKIEKKARAQQYTNDLEKIVLEFPDDIEAKAFLALQLWQNSRSDLPIVSHVAINSVIEDVFDANPMHPAHHYRIHLWDREDAKQALQSAAQCGPSLPGIAHMWHMPGHIYDKLNRFHDAVWQQEASARVDHAHMMRDRVLPDQIHNFAHNNEWLIRNLLKIGRVNDAVSLAKNMQELPRHPKYNTLSKGSTKYGRERLLLTLSSYRLWPELIELADSMYLEPTSDEKLQVERLRYLGIAFALTEKTNEAESIVEQLKQRLVSAEAKISELEELLKADKVEHDSATKDADDQKIDEKTVEEKDSGSQAVPVSGEESADGAKDDASESSDVVKVNVDEKKAAAARARRIKEHEAEIKDRQQFKKTLEKAVRTVEVVVLAGQGKLSEALQGWGETELNDNLLKAEWMFAAEQVDESLELLEKEIKDRPGQLLPLAVKADLVFRSKGADAAKSAFEQVRFLASAADLDTPLLKRLAIPAAELGFSEAWAEEWVAAEDIGERPDLDSLGSFRWSPYMAPDFSVDAADGSQLTLKQLRGKPTVVIFYLGFGCLHCVEQLHAFSPRAEEFRESGIDIVAISTEDVDALKTALATYSKPLDIPLHADPKLSAFKAYRCFDDFEEQPLHGTFLLDPDGRVLWQDISYEPFMDVDFALEESHRLLQLSGFGDQLSQPKPRKVLVGTSNN